MNKLALTWAALKGLLNPFGSVFDSLATYALGRVNAALASIDTSRRETVQSALNVASAALALLNAFAWLCPVKWQTAYKATVEGVQDTCNALFDLHLSDEELAGLRDAFTKAVAAWQSPDDETCVGESALAK